MTKFFEFRANFQKFNVINNTASKFVYHPSIILALYAAQTGTESIRRIRPRTSKVMHVHTEKLLSPL